MNLSEIKKTRIKTGSRIIIYGPEAVGKSSLAAHAPSPIFFDCEDGTARLEVARYPFSEGVGGHVPSTYQQVLDGIDALMKQPHDFKTLVIDTIDQLESLLWNHILERDSKRGSKKLDSIESYGYGKGYIVALDEWRGLALRLDHLRKERAMDVVLLGHAAIRPFRNPEGEDYDRYSLRIKENAGGFLKGWADVVGFCTFEEGGGKLDDDQARAKGWSTGRRLLKLERTAAYDAKSRLTLPNQVELALRDPWQPLGDAIALGENQSPEQLTALIETELGRVGADEAMAAKVRDAVAKAQGNAATLSRYLGELRRRSESATPPTSSSAQENSNV